MANKIDRFVALILSIEKVDFVATEMKILSDHYHHHANLAEEAGRREEKHQYIQRAIRCKEISREFYQVIGRDERG